MDTPPTLIRKRYFGHADQDGAAAGEAPSVPLFHSQALDRGEADWPISAFGGAADPGVIDLGIFRYVAREDPKLGLAHV